MVFFHHREKQFLLTLLLGLTGWHLSSVMASGPRFVHYTTEAGLSQNTVHVILQDRQGFMWFGTDEGLNRFDGARFRVFRNDPNDPASISGNIVVALTQDPDGKVWAGTYNNGLSRWDPVLERFTRYHHDPSDPTSIASDHIRALHLDRRGWLWVGTHDAGLSILKPGESGFEQFRHEPGRAASLGADQVDSFLEDKQGTLWIGTQQGLSRFLPREKAFRNYPWGDHACPHGKKPREVNSLFQAETQTIWVATDWGLWRFDAANQSFEIGPQVDGELCHQETNAFVQAQGDRLWVATEGRGLFGIERDDVVAHIRHNPANLHSPGSDLINTLYLDRSGTLWIGTWGAGVGKWNLASLQFGHIRHEGGTPQGLVHPWVSSILQDRKGRLWIGAFGGGLSMLPASGEPEFIHFTREGKEGKALSHNWVYSLFQDHAGRIWVGTLAGLDLWQEEEETFRHFPRRPEEPTALSGPPSVIYEDSEGRLWMGTRRAGLNRLDGFTPEGVPRFQRFDHDPDQPTSLSHAWVLDILQRRDGSLLVSTFGGGVNLMLEGQRGFHHFRHDAQGSGSLSNDVVYALHEDRQGTLWLGTDSGLNKFLEESGTFAVYRPRAPFSQVIYGVLEDERGILWLSTNKGLARFDPVMVSFVHFDVLDGVQDNEFNLGAFYQSTNGTMYFGGINGLTYFAPENIQLNPHRPPVVFTDVWVNNQRVSLPFLAEEGVFSTNAMAPLSHRDRVLTLEFAALHYSHPGRNRYAYRLAGFDKDWIHVDASRRTATYTNLPPGDYRFQVKAANKDGVWNESGMLLPIQVMPAPWWSWWAISLYALAGLALAAGIGVFVYHYRELADQRALNAKFRQLDKLKDDFLARTSHELRTPMQGIIGLAEAMVEGSAGQLPQKAKDQLGVILYSGRRLSSLVDEILDLSRLENQSLPLHTQPVSLRSAVDITLTLSQGLVADRPLKLVNEVPQDFPMVKADEDRLLQILDNLVGNALRYTQEGEVKVSAVAEDHSALVTVEDTGPGIGEEDLPDIFEPFVRGPGQEGREGSGLGLAVVRQLVQQHGGRIWVDSEPGRGSAFTFNLALVPLSEEPDEGVEDYLPPNPAAIVQDQHGGPQLGKGWRVLVVDDELINRRVMQEFLVLAGYEVVEAVNGVQALRLLDEVRVDLVLLDVMMPDLSGFEVCRRIRKTIPPHQLPVIFLSAKSGTSGIITGQAAGANDYLVKPVHKDELLARVAIHLDLLRINRTLEQTSPTGEPPNFQALQTRLLADISHELRTPLSLIMAPVREMLETPQSLPEERLKQCLDHVKRNGEKLTTLVDQLLDVSRLEMGQLNLNTAVGDLVAFTSQIAEGFALWANQENRHFRWELPKQRILMPFDRDKLEKVLQNLLSNAFKFTPLKGKVLLRLTANREQVLFTVKDTGPGIPRDQQAKVFDRFFQARHGEGWGIGLSLAKDLVTLMGGEIELVSDPGFGSTFMVALVRPEVEVVDAETQGCDVYSSPQLSSLPQSNTGQALESGLPLVFLAEHHEDQRRYLAQALGEDFRMQSFADGHELLEALRQQPPQVVVSDVALPRLDGLQLCTRIKGDAATNHIPVILLTLRDGAEDRIQGLEAGADDYLVKPVSVSELTARIHNLIRQRARLEDKYAQTRQLSLAGQELSLQEDSFLERVIAALAANLGNSQFGVYELARELGLSRRQLLRKIKQVTGGGPGDLMRSYRLEQASKLLREGKVNVSQVAYAVGFRNAAHFSTLFRETFGQTPSDYMNQNLQNPPSPE